MSDIETIAHIVGRGFFSDPISEWLVPNEHDRLAILSAHIELLVAPAIELGSVHFADRSGGGDLHGGVAVWFNVEGGRIPEPYDRQRLRDDACEVYTDMFAALEGTLDAKHPRPPHHRLVLLAVWPGRQGTGIGSALLAHHHRVLDERNIPAYLAANNDGAVRLFLRHGYQLTGKDPVIDAVGAHAASNQDRAIRIRPMWRESSKAANA